MSSTSNLGPSLQLTGKITGKEDVQISGQIEGEIHFPDNTVVISRSAQIDAGIQAKRIEVEGTVKGNLDGADEVVIRKTGRVEGNLKAPRVTLEDGATFRGSVDMRSGHSSAAPAKPTPSATPPQAGGKKAVAR